MTTSAMVLALDWKPGMHGVNLVVDIQKSKQVRKGRDFIHLKKI